MLMLLKRPIALEKTTLLIPSLTDEAEKTQLISHTPLPPALASALTVVCQPSESSISL